MSLLRCKASYEYSTATLSPKPEIVVEVSCWWTSKAAARLERKLDEGYYFRQKVVSLWARNLLHWVFQFHWRPHSLKII